MKILAKPYFHASKSENLPGYNRQAMFCGPPLFRSRDSVFFGSNTLSVSDASNFKPVSYAVHIAGETVKAKRIGTDDLAARLPDARMIALGDLHGCYEKLVDTLLATGLAHFESGEDLLRYRQMSLELRRLVLKAPFKAIDENYQYRPGRTEEEKALETETIRKIQAQIRSLQSLLRRLKWREGAGNIRPPKLLLIGDVTADRGIADVLTLGLLLRFNNLENLRFKQVEDLDENARIITIAGNHDHEAFRYIANRNLHEIDPVQRGSLFRSRMMLAKGPFMQIDEDDKRVEVLHEDYRLYLSQLKLMHYDSAAKTLFAHAPITVDNIEALIGRIKAREKTQAKKPLADLGVNCYEDIKEGNLAGFVNAANSYYRNYVRGGKLNDDDEDVLYNGKKAFLKIRPAESGKQSDPPFMKLGVQVLVHGHFERPPVTVSDDYRMISLDTKVKQLDGTIRDEVTGEEIFVDKVQKGPSILYAINRVGPPQNPGMTPVLA